MTTDFCHPVPHTTAYQQRVIARREEIKEAYLNHASAILMKKISPFQIMCRLSENFGMTLGGVRKILLETGVYINRSTPVVMSVTSPAKQTVTTVSSSVQSVYNNK